MIKVHTANNRGFTRTPQDTSRLRRFFNMYLKRHKDNPSTPNTLQRQPTRAEVSLVSGFTLLELIVSVSLFIVVMTISVGSIIAIIDASKKARSLQSVMNNLNFALDDMTRNIRVSTDWHCATGISGSMTSPRACGISGDALAMTSPLHEDNRVIYYYDTSLNPPRLTRSENGTSGPFVPITSSEIQIEHFQFVVRGPNPTDGRQPFARIEMKGAVLLSDGTGSDFNIQSTVTQRVPDG